MAHTSWMARSSNPAVRRRWMSASLIAPRLRQLHRIIEHHPIRRRERHSPVVVRYPRHQQIRFATRDASPPEKRPEPRSVVLDSIVTSVGPRHGHRDHLPLDPAQGVGA